MAEPRTLTGLLAHIDGRRRERDAALGDTGAAAAPYPRLHALDDFRQLCSQLRTRERMRASLAPPPPDAGPLNSTSLAHRALGAMRDASPGYLQHFMAYLDALAWLEELQAAGGLPKEGRPGPTAQGRRARGDGRRRRAR